MQGRWWEGAGGEEGGKTLVVKFKKASKIIAVSHYAYHQLCDQNI